MTSTNVVPQVSKKLAKISCKMASFPLGEVVLPGNKRVFFSHVKSSQDVEWGCCKLMLKRLFHSDQFPLSSVLLGFPLDSD